MRKYVFFANTISGISGGTIYIRNKKQYLEKNGWEVVVFDNASNRGSIMEDLVKYKNNRLFELSFPPSWYRRKERKQIISKIVDLIQPKGEGVIESVQIPLSLWGEIIAEQLNWQHLIYDINEKDVITDRAHFDYLYKKLIQNQLFFISEKACLNAFSKYTEINDASNHHWQAGVDNEISDVRIQKIDEIKKATYNIGYFGRYKPFMPYLVSQIKTFSERNPNSDINFIVLGFEAFPENEKNALDHPNLKVVCVEAQPIIPNSFFEKTDIIIATAGCASIAYRHGATVISMDVESETPLGILGYTTNNTTYADAGLLKDDRDIVELLDYIYSNKEQFTTANHISSKHHFNINKIYDNHISYITNNKSYYNVLSIYNANTFLRLIQMLFVKIGGSFFLFNIKQKYNL